MAATTFARIEICACCLMALANADTSGHDFSCEGAPEPLALWVESSNSLVLGGEEEGFSWSACEGCGSHLGGDRFRAYVAA